MKKYDVAIIGGGPAGLLAAGRAAEGGASVVLLEKNRSLGVKLLMTGGGRCNLTNRSAARALAEGFGVNGRWLLSGLSRFGAEEIIDFLAGRGVRTKTEAGGRVFPQSGQARAVLEALLDYAKNGKVEIRTSAAVRKIIGSQGRIVKLILADQTEIVASNFIIATGGASYPLSGSSGDAYAWLKALGHKIIAPCAALCPIIVKEKIKELEGLSIADAVLTLYHNQEKIGREAGDFLFTSRGLSGPAALNLSRTAAQQGKSGLEIKIDFFPDEDAASLDEKLKEATGANKQLAVKNILGRLTHKRLAGFILSSLAISPDKKGDSLTKPERKALVNSLKGYHLTVRGLAGFEEAMVTAGGVSLKEVDPKTMASKIIANLYLAGEVLDLAGPTGGYNLQAAWTTGYLAGENAARNLSV